MSGASQSAQQDEKPAAAFFGYLLLWVAAETCVGSAWLLRVLAASPSQYEATSSGGDAEVATGLTLLLLLALAVPMTFTGLLAAGCATVYRPRGRVFFVASLVGVLACGAFGALIA